MKDCIFCEIAAGIIPCKKVFEDDHVLAFHDKNPLAPTHILIIPKKHYYNMESLDAADQALLGHMLHTVNAVAQQENINNDGYRVAINCGAWGRQVVQHLHIHLLGGRKLANELG